MQKHLVTCNSKSYFRVRVRHCLSDLKELRRLALRDEVQALQKFIRKMRD